MDMGKYEKIKKNLRNLVYFFLLFFSEISYSDSEPPLVVINSDSFQIYLAGYSELMIDESASMSLLEVIEMDSFLLRDVGKVREFNDSNHYWYRYRVKNELDYDMVMILKTHARTLTNATLYQMDLSYPEGVSQIVAEQSFGDWQGFSNRQIRSRKYALALNVPAHTEHTFYLKWQDNGQDVYEMELVDIANFFTGEMIAQAYNFLTLGFALGVLIYNISIYRRTKDSIYLSYSAYIFAFIAFLETQNGSMAAIWPKFLGVENLAIFAFSSAYLVILTLLRFTVQILLLQEREPDRANWFNLLQWLSLVLFILCFIVPFQVAEYSVYFTSSMTVVFALYESYRIRSKYNDLFAKTYMTSFIPLGLSVVGVSSIYVFETLAFPYMTEVIRIAFCINLMMLSNSLADQLEVMAKKQQRYEASLVAARTSQAIKNEFFGKMSHEIRTPLNGVIGASQLLQTSQLDNEQKKYVDILRASSNSLMHLVNNIVDFSKVEAGKMNIVEEDFNLKDLLLDLEKVFMLRILETGIPLLYEVGEDVPLYLYGDVNRIRQILINLLSNAYKFTEKGVIRIIVSRYIKSDCEFYQFEVIDTGIGIPASQVESIFEDFTQIYTRDDRKYGGAGLGLSICRELCHLMGGEILLSSQPEKGSNFYFQIPLKRNIEHLNGAHTFALNKNPVLNSKSVLIIDDCIYCRESLSKACDSWGMKVGAEESLADALASVRKSSDVGVKLDLIIIDIDCLESQVGGNHFIEALSRHKASQDSVLLLLSGNLHANKRFNDQLNYEKGFLFQRYALKNMYEAVFVAALEKNSDFFEENSLLLNESLEEMFTKDFSR